MVRSGQLLADSRKWRVENFVEHNGTSWKTNMVRQKFEWKDASDILAMELSHNPSNDFIYQKFHASGKFTIKSRYAMLMENKKVKKGRKN